MQRAGPAAHKRARAVARAQRRIATRNGSVMGGEHGRVLAVRRRQGTDDSSDSSCRESGPWRPVQGPAVALGASRRGQPPGAGGQDAWGRTQTRCRSRPVGRTPCGRRSPRFDRGDRGGPSPGLRPQTDASYGRGLGTPVSRGSCVQIRVTATLGRRRCTPQAFGPRSTWALLFTDNPGHDGVLTPGERSRGASGGPAGPRTLKTGGSGPVILKRRHLGGLRDHQAATLGVGGSRRALQAALSYAASVLLIQEHKLLGPAISSLQTLASKLGWHGVPGAVRRGLSRGPHEAPRAAPRPLPEHRPTN